MLITGHAAGIHNLKCFYARTDVLRGGYFRGVSDLDIRHHGISRTQ